MTTPDAVRLRAADAAVPSAPGASVGRWRTLPIRGRMAAWYAGSVGAVLVVAALAFRLVFAQALSAEFDRSLEASADLARSFFRLELEEYESAEATVTHFSAEVAFPDRRLEFVRPDGRIVVGARGAAAARSGPTRQHEEALDPLRAPRWRVRVVASTAPLDRPLRQVDALFLLGIPFGAGLAGGVGWWLAGRTLRPVARMAAATELIAPGAALRLPVANPHDELGRLGSRFNALLDRLDAVLAAQQRFLADAAHELRTPVARMLSGVELALLDRAPAEQHVTALARVHGDLQRTSRLVDELLQLARADAARGGAAERMARDRLFLDDLVADVLGAWQPAADAAGVRLLQSVVDEAPVRGDAVLLDRLLGVLVDNAIRYTPGGGTVDVRVVRRDDASAGASVVEVIDTGIGIDPDDRAHASERFWRGSRARQRCPDGSGLGLAIAHGIAEAHGAALALEPRAGGGTIARVSFPDVDPPLRDRAPTDQGDQGTSAS